MEWLADPTAWLGLLTLIVLELVLGIDNLVFIAILADKLPPHQRDRARVIGLSLALIMRLGLLASISWMVTLTAPLFEVFGKSFSGRDLIMLFGGVFLLFKATMELHERLEGHVAQRVARAHAAFWPIVAQIVVLDAVFSLDAVITAVGMVEQLSVMMIAVIFSIGIMIVASKPLTRFVNAHPTVIMLCLGFDDDRLQPDRRRPGLPYPQRLPVRGHRLLDPDRAVQPAGPRPPQAQRATAPTAA
jgi:predicted tellurium resistance membrane protein TerC